MRDGWVITARDQVHRREIAKRDPDIERVDTDSLRSKSGSAASLKAEPAVAADPDERLLPFQSGCHLSSLSVRQGRCGWRADVQARTNAPWSYRARLATIAT